MFEKRGIRGSVLMSVMNLDDRIYLETMLADGMLDFALSVQEDGES